MASELILPSVSISLPLPFTSFAPELSTQVLIYLDDQDILNFCSTCREIKQYVDNNNVFWHAKIQKSLLMNVDDKTLEQHNLTKDLYLHIKKVTTIFITSVEKRSKSDFPYFYYLLKILINSNSSISKLTNDQICGNKFLSAWSKFIVQKITEKEKDKDEYTRCIVNLLNVVPIPYTILCQNHTINEILKIVFMDKPFADQDNLQLVLKFLDKITFQTGADLFNFIVSLIQFACKFRKDESDSDISTSIIVLCMMKLKDPIISGVLINTHLDKFMKNVSTLYPTVELDMLIIGLKYANEPAIQEVLRYYLNRLNKNEGNLWYILSHVDVDIDINIMASYAPYQYSELLKTIIRNYVKHHPNTIMEENLKKVLDS